MCEQLESSFFSTQIRFIGFQCDSLTLYVSLIVGYMILIMGTHKIHINTIQAHREALSQEPNRRNIFQIAKYNIAQTVIHIVFVLFITSNNLGFIIASVIAHCVGTIIVYKNQRKDHKHPISTLADAIRTMDQTNTTLKKDLEFILTIVPKKKIMENNQVFF